jgi:hypothetical protein
MEEKEKLEEIAEPKIIDEFSAAEEMKNWGIQVFMQIYSFFSLTK